MTRGTFPTTGYKKRGGVVFEESEGEGLNLFGGGGREFHS